MQTGNVFIQIGSEKREFSIDEVNRLLREGKVKSTDLAWMESWAAWQPVANVPGVVVPPPIPTNTSNPTPAPASSKKKLPGSEKRIPAGVWALLAGYMGIHKFILGYTGAGKTMLFTTFLPCCCGWIIMWPIALVEGVVYLTMSDEEFVKTYITGRKEWF